MVDLNQCKPGDVLVRRDGFRVVYLRREAGVPDWCWPHLMEDGESYRSDGAWGALRNGNRRDIVEHVGRSSSEEAGQS